MLFWTWKNLALSGQSYGLGLSMFKKVTRSFSIQFWDKWIFRYPTFFTLLSEMYTLKLIKWNKTINITWPDKKRMKCISVQRPQRPSRRGSEVVASSLVFDEDSCPLLHGGRIFRIHTFFFNSIIKIKDIHNYFEDLFRKGKGG